MKTYLSENPDVAQGLEFLCLAEGDEVAHYEVLEAISKKFNNRKLQSTVRSILREEKTHLNVCLDMAKEAVAPRINNSF
jgi:ferritin-like metal-binding protein YciE